MGFLLDILAGGPSSEQKAAKDTAFTLKTADGKELQLLAATINSVSEKNIPDHEKGTEWNLKARHDYKGTGTISVSLQHIGDNHFVAQEQRRRLNGLPSVSSVSLSYKNGTFSNRLTGEAVLQAGNISHVAKIGRKSPEREGYAGIIAAQSSQAARATQHA